MIDPELKYCLQCQDEYRADIELCGVCGEKLRTGIEVQQLEEERRLQKGDRSGVIEAGDELASIRKGPLADLRHLEKLLQAEDIGTLIAGDESSCRGGCCASSFILYVRVQDVQDAFAVLEKDFIKNTGLAHHDLSHIGAVYDAEQQEAMCPACGFIFQVGSTACPDCGLSLG